MKTIERLYFDILTTEYLDRATDIHETKNGDFEFYDDEYNEDDPPKLYGTGYDTFLYGTGWGACCLQLLDVLSADGIELNEENEDEIKQMIRADIESRFN